MWLVVELGLLIFFSTSLAVQFDLLLDVVMVLLERLLPLSLGLSHLVLALLD